MRATLVAVALVLLGQPALAFDGVRKGFVLGLGAGVAPWASLDSSDESGDAPVDESSVGVGYQFIIGYGWNDQNWLVYEGNVLGRHSGAYDTSFFQGINGLSWYHAFGARGHSWVSAVGAGLQIASTGNYFRISFNGPPLPAGPPSEYGFGALLGAGYEFSPRWMVMLYGTSGTTMEHTTRFQQSNVSLLLQHLWD